MRHKFIVFLVINSLVINIQAQDNSLKLKLDSIVKETDLLYRYEKITWVSTDLLMSDKKMSGKYGGYVVYHSNDSMFISFVDKKQKDRIAKYCFLTNDLTKPIFSEKKTLSLSLTEQKLLEIKTKIINQLSDQKYEVGIPQGYNPNLVLIKEENIFKLYILMGTSESGIIPFGNDYLFWSDLEGNITNWKKFHSRMVPAPCKSPDGEKVRSVIHSHLKSTPYITATDICTFRLYAGFCDLKEFKVLCTATGKYYTYNMDTNQIEVTEP